MEKRYTALRIIATVYKVLGVIAGVITLLAVLGICASSLFGGAMLDRFNELGRSGPMGLFTGAVGGLIAGLAGLIYGGGLALTLYAAGEGISLLIALEENTRATATYLYRLQHQTNPPGQGSAT